MKKISLILMIFILSGCFNKDKDILNKLEISNVNCTIEKEINNHKGFLGDGDYFAKIKCTNLKESKLSKNWKELPLSEALDTFTNMEMCDDKGCKNMYEKYNIPNIKDGHYLFLDRHSMSKDKYNDEDINERSSYNLTIAIYDDKNTIYYYEFDS